MKPWSRLGARWRQEGVVVAETSIVVRDLNHGRHWCRNVLDTAVLGQVARLGALRDAAADAHRQRRLVRVDGEVDDRGPGEGHAFIFSPLGLLPHARCAHRSQLAASAACKPPPPPRYPLDQHSHIGAGCAQQPARNALPMLARGLGRRWEKVLLVSELERELAKGKVTKLPLE